VSKHTAVDTFSALQLLVLLGGCLLVTCMRNDALHLTFASLVFMKCSTPFGKPTSPHDQVHCISLVSDQHDQQANVPVYLQNCCGLWMLALCAYDTGSLWQSRRLAGHDAGDVGLVCAQFVQLNITVGVWRSHQPHLEHDMHAAEDVAGKRSVPVLHAEYILQQGLGAPTQRKCGIC
jgi:hypothetical protein